MGKYMNEINSEKELIKQRKQELKNLIEASKPKKKADKKEFYGLPITSQDCILSNKTIPFKTYSSIILKSNWGGCLLNNYDRYIYENSLLKSIDEICAICNISKKTFKRHLNLLKKCDIGLIDTLIAPNGELVYKLKYACDKGLNFVTIDNIALRKLCIAYSEYALRLYVVFKYMCVDITKNPKTNKYVVTNKETHLTQEWLCKKIGIKHSYRTIITECVDALVSGGFIKVRKEYKYSKSHDENRNEFLNKVPYLSYSLSDEYLKKR